MEEKKKKVVVAFSDRTRDTPIRSAHTVLHAIVLIFLFIY